MKRSHYAAICFSVLCYSLSAAPQAFAFCGVMEESVQAMNPSKAAKKAEKRVKAKVKDLKRQYGKKLALDERQSACVGGALAIDASGKETVGPATCTVTQSFCVNP